MRKLIVTLETVTPMFLAGADGQTPELRAPSVIGQLRYWLRAALGGVLGNNLDALKQAEAEVFGDTNGTGAVSVRVRWLGNAPTAIKEKTLLHPSAKNPVEMHGFPVKSKFQIILTWNNRNAHIQLITISALLLMASIGGLGRRCRRGWGTVKIIDAQGLGEEWRDKLTRQIELAKLLPFVHDKAVNFCQKLGLESKNKPNIFKYTSLSQVAVFKNKSFESYKKAISDFGENEHHWLASNKNLVQSIGFAAGQKRQASPLWLRLIPTPNGYEMVAILFNVDFPGANYEAVKKFLDHAHFKEIPL